MTASAFLISGAQEPEYGLYSYILFGSRPEFGSDQWRGFQGTIAAFLLIPDIHEMKDVPRARLNITLLPVTSLDRELPGASTPFFRFDGLRLGYLCLEQPEGDRYLANHGLYARSDPGAACILVDRYDYGRAETLLAHFPGPHMVGPYIVSVTRPLSKADSLPQHYLYQDLSSVPPELSVLWVKEFMAQAQEEEFWKNRTKDQFILGLRTAIAQVKLQLDFTKAIEWHLATVTPQR